MTRPFGSLVLLLGVALSGRLALGAQFVLTDVTYEHTAKNTVDAHFTAPQSAQTPKNWHSPVDYMSRGASWRVRLEVMTKPTAAKMTIWFCASGAKLPGAIRDYDCSVAPMFITTAGPYEWTRSIPTGQVDWSKPLSRIDFIPKDEQGAKISPDRGYVGADKFLPMKLRATVTIIGGPRSGDGGADADVASDASLADARDEARPSDAALVLADAGSPTDSDAGSPDGATKQVDARLRVDLPDTPLSPSRAKSPAGGCAVGGGGARQTPWTTLGALALSLLAGSIARRRFSREMIRKSPVRRSARCRIWPRSTACRGRARTRGPDESRSCRRP